MSGNCSHTTSQGRWVDEYDDWTGETEQKWVSEEVSLQVDLDLHRYQCSRCKLIGYYSGAAKAYYENGTRAPGVQGLE